MGLPFRVVHMQMPITVGVVAVGEGVVLAAGAPLGILLRLRLVHRVLRLHLVQLLPAAVELPTGMRWLGIP